MQTTNQNAPSLTIWRHDRPNERIHKRRHNFRLLLFPHTILQPLGEIIEQKQKHQVPRDHCRMDVESGEMKFDLILFLRGRGELFVRPVRTDKRREDVATYTRRPEGDMLAHSPSSTTNNRLRSQNVKIKSEDGGEIAASGREWRNQQKPKRYHLRVEAMHHKMCPKLPSSGENPPSHITGRNLQTQRRDSDIATPKEEKKEERGNKNEGGIEEPGYSNVTLGGPVFPENTLQTHAKPRFSVHMFKCKFSANSGGTSTSHGRADQDQNAAASGDGTGPHGAYPITRQS